MDIAEDDERPVVGRERSGQEIADGDSLGRIGDVLGGTHEPFERPAGAAAPSKRVERAVASYPEQPRPRVPSVRERLATLERHEQGLLEHVFGKRTVAQDLDEELPEVNSYRLDELLEAGAVRRREL